jgi:hypothetical protein
MTTQQADATQGRVTLGLSLKPGQLPSAELRRGDRVAVYAVAGQNTGVAGGTLLANDAIVQDVQQQGEGTLESNQTRISVAVPPEQAPALAQAASAGAAAVALIPPGTSVPGQPATGKQPANQNQNQGQNQSQTQGQTGQQTGPPGGG